MTGTLSGYGFTVVSGSLTENSPGGPLVGNADIVFDSGAAALSGTLGELNLRIEAQFSSGGAAGAAVFGGSAQSCDDALGAQAVRNGGGSFTGNMWWGQPGQGTAQESATIGNLSDPGQHLYLNAQFYRSGSSAYMAIRNVEEQAMDGCFEMDRLRTPGAGIADGDHVAVFFSDVTVFAIAFGPSESGCV